MCERCWLFAEERVNKRVQQGLITYGDVEAEYLNLGHRYPTEDLPCQQETVVLSYPTAWAA